MILRESHNPKRLDSTHCVSSEVNHDLSIQVEPSDLGIVVNCADAFILAHELQALGCIVQCLSGCRVSNRMIASFCGGSIGAQKSRAVHSRVSGQPCMEGLAVCMPRSLSWAATNSGIFIFRGRHKSVVVDGVRKLWAENCVRTLVL